MICLKAYDTKVMDEVVTALKQDTELRLSSSNLTTTPQCTGYSRYFKLRDFDVSLIMDTTKWKNPNSYATHYWLKLSNYLDGKLKQDDQCKKALIGIPDKENDGVYIANKGPLLRYVR